MYKPLICHLCVFICVIYMCFVLAKVTFFISLHVWINLSAHSVVSYHCVLPKFPNFCQFFIIFGDFANIMCLYIFVSMYILINMVTLLVSNELLIY